MSKVDPRKLQKVRTARSAEHMDIHGYHLQVDEHTTLWLEVARAEADPNAARRATLRRATSFRSHHSEARSRSSVNPSHHDHGHSHGHRDSDAAPQLHLQHHVHNESNPDDLWSFDSDVQSTREIVEKTEEPGIDALRGTFGAIGTIIRAKRRIRALSAASHATRGTASEDSDVRSRTSTTIRPSWLSGHWATPKGSRFQPMHGEHDMEKGHVEIVGVTNEKENITNEPWLASPTAVFRDPSLTIPTASSSTVPLNALAAHSPTIHFPNESISSDSLLSSANKHGSLMSMMQR